MSAGGWIEVETGRFTDRDGWLTGCHYVVSSSCRMRVRFGGPRWALLSFGGKRGADVKCVMGRVCYIG